MAQSNDPNVPLDQYCFNFTGFAIEHGIKKRTKCQQVTTQSVSSISYTRYGSLKKNKFITGQIIDAEVEAASPKADEVRCLVVGLLICTSDGRPCFDYTANQVSKATSVEARDPKSCVDLPSGSSIWRVVVPLHWNKRAGIKTYALGVKEVGSLVFLPLICKQEYVFFYSEFRGGETTVSARRKGWIDRICDEIRKIKMAEDTGKISGSPDASALEVQNDISPTVCLPSELSTGPEQSDIVELSNKQSPDRNASQHSEKTPVAFNLACHLPAASVVWSYLDVSDAEVGVSSHLSVDRSITSNENYHCNDSDSSSCSSEASLFNDTSHFVEKNEHNFSGNNDAYAAVLTEVINQWPDLKSSVSVEILQYLRRGLEENSAMITHSMVPAFFSHGTKIMHNFRDEIIMTSGNYRDDLLRDVVATIVDDIETPNQLKACMPPDKPGPQPIAVYELFNMIQERIPIISKITRNSTDPQTAPDQLSLLNNRPDCVAAYHDGPYIESLKKGDERIAQIKKSPRQPSLEL